MSDSSSIGSGLTQPGSLAKQPQTSRQPEQEMALNAQHNINPRYARAGGLPGDVFLELSNDSPDVWVADQGLASYRGRG